MTDETTQDNAAVAQADSSAWAGATTASATPTIEETAVANTPDTTASESVTQLTLQEYMVKLSQRDARVELIHAFAHSELQAGRVKDVESNFESRLVAFSQQAIEE